MTLSGRALKSGSQGDEVKLLHAFLQQLGFSIEPKERDAIQYGASTAGAVSAFQAKHGLKPTGEMDAATAKAINTAIDQLQSAPKPDPVPPPKPDPNAVTLFVKGNVRATDGGPLSGITVRAFDADLPSLSQDQALGQPAVTDGTGFYQIAYTTDQFSRAEKGSADLRVHASTSGGVEIARSEVLFNAPPVAVIDLVAAGYGKAAPSEYERLLAAVTPLIGNIAIADLTDPDQTFLAGETGFAQAYVNVLVLAFRDAAASDGVMNPAVFYGLMREGLPRDLNTLLLQSPDVVRKALATAVAANIIPAQVAANPDQILDQLKALAIRQVLSQKDEGSFTDLLATALPDPGQHIAFLTAFAGRKGTVEEFWAGLRSDPGLKEHADALQFSLGACIIAANHVPLVKALANKRNAGELGSLVDLTKHDERDWQLLLTQSDGKAPIGVPDGVAGKDLNEKAANYARVISHRLEDAFPMPFFQHRLQADDVPGKADLLTFLSDNADFDLRSTRVEAYVKGKPESMNKVGDVEGTKGMLKSMQRVYHVAPRYGHMSTLLKAGIDSAQHIARLGKIPFIEQFAGSFGGADVASQIHETSRQAAAVILNAAVTYAPIAGRRSMHAVPDEPVRDLDGVPEWSTLFGSIELCDCQHCRSVYSPAAYFVDLLHFLRDRRAVAPETSALQVLLQRRPDLADIELTCENTNTPVPYVDLVNEVLEEAVHPSPAFAPFVLEERLASDLNRRTPSAALREAFGTALSANAVITSGGQAGVWGNSQSWWNIDGEAWTYTVVPEPEGRIRVVSRSRQTKGSADERRAAPQYINRAAYDKVLSRAVYPWSLPFELGAEEARVFLRPLGASRRQLMETFLPGGREAVLNSRSVARAHLDIGLKESDLINGRAADPAVPLQALVEQWGFPAATDLTAALSGHLDVLLKHAGLKYVEMVELLQSYYVNPAMDGVRPLRITGPSGRDADTCSTALLRLDGLNTTAASRILRFVRLRLRLGWPVRDLDRALLAFGPADPRTPNAALDDPDFIVRLSHVQRLTAATGLPLMSVLAWWAPATSAFWTAEYSIPIDKSAYAQLLRGRAMPVAQSGGLPEDPNLLGATTLLAAGTVLTAALGVTAGDLSQMVNGIGLPPGGMDAALNMGNLTALHRHAALARSAGLSIRDYLTFLRLGGVDPFAGTVNCLLFLEQLAHMRSTGFTPAEADYLLQHRVNEGDRIGPRPQDVAAALSEVRAELQKIATDNTFISSESAPGLGAATADPAGELTRRKLAELNWDAALIDKVVAALNQTPNTPEAAISAAAVIARACKCFVHDFSVPLAALPPGLRFPRELGQRVFFDAAVGSPRLHFRGVMTEIEQSTLLMLAPDPAYVAAVRALYGQPNDLPGDLFLTSGPVGDVELMFGESVSPAQRFIRLLQKLLPYLRRTLSERLLVQKLATLFTLDAAIMDPILRRWVVSSADRTKPVLEDFLESAFAESNPNVPATAFVIQVRAYLRLHKIALLATKLRLTSLQVGWIFEGGAAAGGPDLNALPVSSGESPASLDNLLRLIALDALRDALPGGETTLGGLLQLGRPGTTSGAEVYTRVSELTQWNEGDLRFLTGADGFNMVLPQALRDADTLTRLQTCFAMMNKVGMSARQCRALCGDFVTGGLGEQVMQAARAKRGEADWIEAILPLQNELRELRRNALTEYLIAHSTGQWPNTNALYAHFLIDVEMAPCTVTSRIKQAISSTQLYVQRCLLNLEDDVKANAEIDDRWHDWRWMKSYRVWEANRKVFLYPENWLEPELRDDKSSFFRALESELMQGDLTLERAEDAFIHYVEQLDQVARLEVMGTYHQVEFNDNGQPVLDVLHVFARTPAEPRIFYYRQRVDTEWTAWEKIDVNVRGEHLIPVVWQRRIFLFWAIFSDPVGSLNVQLTDGSMTTEQPPRYREIQLAFSERKNGRWTEQKLTSMLRTDRAHASPSRFSFHTQFESDGSLTILVVPEVRTEFGSEAEEAPCRAFSFDSPAFDATEVRRIAPLVGLTETVRISMTLSGATTQLYLPAPQDSRALSNATSFYSIVHQADERRFGREPFFFTGPAFRAPALKGDVPRDIPRSGTTFLVTPVRAKTRGVAASWPGANVLNPDLANMAAANLAPVAGSSLMVNPTSTGKLAISFPLARADAKGQQTVSGSSDTAASGPPLLLFIGPLLAPVHSEDLYRFRTFYHPYARVFMHQLNGEGVPGLLQRQVQLQPQLLLPRTPGGAPSPLNFNTAYGPEAVDRPIVGRPYPKEDVDFERDGAYALYNWELFVHAPLLVADRLSKNQRFEEAQQWLHYIFNPTDTSRNDSPQRYWQTRKFFETTREGAGRQQIQNLLRLLAEGADPRSAAALRPEERQDLEAVQTAIRLWRKNPFKPHVVARLRTVAYQKSVVMKYIDNLIAWGDQLFRRDTIESMNEAAQLYVLAAEILGRRPDKVPARNTAPPQTYASLAAKLDDFSNALVDLESLMPPVPDRGAMTVDGEARLTLPAMLYFCIPQNDKLLGYWDTVEDRLFKIRHCMNIEGMVRQLPLFEPPIDPALLVRAAAAGVDLRSVLSDSAAAVPHYRFTVLAGRANELVAEVKALGSALLAALEKGDAEGLALLRSGHEKALLRSVRAVRERQLQEARANLTTLDQSRKLAEQRYLHYQTLLGHPGVAVPAAGTAVQDEKAPAGATILSREGVKLNQSEISEQEALSAANLAQQLAAGADWIASILSVLPQAHATPFGVGAAFGGLNLGNAMSAFSNISRMVATQSTFTAGRQARIGQFYMRESEWVLQSNLAGKEIMQIDRQIAAADIRVQIAENELRNHDIQIRNADETDAYMRDKFTNQDLYMWMSGQVANIYFLAYQLAYDMARRAERAFRFELGLNESSYVQFGYWDSLKKGLLAGERLGHDLKRMEMAYLDGNRRDYEISKNISLVLHDPLALIRLKTAGQCIVRLPEDLFDADYPGHYMRRIRSVSLTIPAVVGPYTSINCTLTLLNSKIRLKATGEYEEDEPDPRFAYGVTPLQSIATSHGQADSGLFDLNFRDERYLPFECAGAISDWRIEMPKDTNAFDFDTITDVVLRINYTARDGGSDLRTAARGALRLGSADPVLVSAAPSAMRRLFSLKHEYATEWYRFLQSPAPPMVGFDLTPDRFPFQVRGRSIRLQQCDVFVLRKETTGPAPTGISLAKPDGDQVMRDDSGTERERPVWPLGPWPEPDPSVGNLLRASVAFGVDATLDGLRDGQRSYRWSLTINGLDGGAPMALRQIEDVWVVCQFTAL